MGCKISISLLLEYPVEELVKIFWETIFWPPGFRSLNSWGSPVNEVFEDIIGMPSWVIFRYFVQIWRSPLFHRKNRDRPIHFSQINCQHLRKSSPCFFVSGLFLQPLLVYFLQRTELHPCHFTNRRPRNPD